MTGRFRPSPDRTCRGEQAVAVDACTSVPFPWKRVCVCLGRCWFTHQHSEDHGESHFNRPHQTIATIDIRSRWQEAPRGPAQRCNQVHQTGFFKLIPLRRSMRPFEEQWSKTFGGPRQATTSPLLACLRTSRLGSALVAVDPTGHSKRVRCGADIAITARQREQSLPNPRPDS